MTFRAYKAEVLNQELVISFGQEVPNVGDKLFQRDKYAGVVAKVNKQGIVMIEGLHIKEALAIHAAFASGDKIFSLTKIVSQNDKKEILLFDKDERIHILIEETQARLNEIAEMLRSS